MARRCVRLRRRVVQRTEGVLVQALQVLGVRSREGEDERLSEAEACWSGRRGRWRGGRGGRRWSGRWTRGRRRGGRGVARRRAAARGGDTAGRCVAARRDAGLGMGSVCRGLMSRGLVSGDLARGRVSIRQGGVRRPTRLHAASVSWRRVVRVVPRGRAVRPELLHGGRAEPPEGRPGLLHVVLLVVVWRGKTAKLGLLGVRGRRGAVPLMWRGRVARLLCVLLCALLGRLGSVLIPDVLQRGLEPRPGVKQTIPCWCTVADVGLWSFRPGGRGVHGWCSLGRRRLRLRSRLLGAVHLVMSPALRPLLGPHLSKLGPSFDGEAGHAPLIDDNVRRWPDGKVPR